MGEKKKKDLQLDYRFTHLICILIKNSVNYIYDSRR